MNIQKKANLVIFIHGFQASSLSAKGTYLKEQFEDFINPSLPISPKLQFITLDQLVQAFSKFYHQITLIGSSLGGFLSICLLKKYPNLCKVVLINPAVHCEVTLSKYIGENEDFGGTKFVLNNTHIQELSDLKTTLDEQTQKERVLLLVQTGDQLLDYKEALQYLPHAQTDIYQGGDHSYINLDQKMDLIKKFVNSPAL
ncbi:hypothetical protein ABPG72_016044 [Tetrahymena utriculariae]